MDQTSSTKLLYTSEVLPLINPVQSLQASIRGEVIPSFDVMLYSTPDHYPYMKRFDAAKNEPILILHSSGSTGTTLILINR